jgi:hypothetical protein
MHHRQQQGQGERGHKESFNLMVVVMAALAASAWPFCRIRFGREGLGLAALLAGGLMLLVGCFAQADEMFAFLFAWLLAVIYQRAMTVSMEKKGIRQHSRYTGFPWICMLLTFGRMPEEKAKFLEPFICAGVAALFYNYGHPVLGGYLFACALGLVVVSSMQDRLRQVRLTAMEDAMMEQQAMAEALRERMGNYRM